MFFSAPRLARFLRRPLHDQLNSLHAVLARVKTRFYYRHVFGSVGRGTVIHRPLLLSNPRFVYVGENTLIRPGARIEAILINEAALPELIIGNNVNIEQNVHLVCSSRLVIGNNVSIIGHCAVVDTAHPYEDIRDARKIGDRIDTKPRMVSIGENTFLGFGTVVLPGVSIGKHCVVGANSTVTKDIPDYSVVAGNPARILKRFDHSTSEWVKQGD